MMMSGVWCLKDIHLHLVIYIYNYKPYPYYITLHRDFTKANKKNQVGSRQTSVGWSPYSCGCWKEGLDSWSGHVNRTVRGMAAGLPWSEGWEREREREREKKTIVVYNLISEWHTIPSATFCWLHRPTLVQCWGDYTRVWIPGGRLVGGHLGG